VTTEPFVRLVQPIDIVCLDAMGVLYRCRDDLRDLLIPFVTSRSRSSATEVADVYRRCFVGEIASAELWSELGVAGDPAALDVAHLSSHGLVPGVKEFLARCATRGLRVACISNDVSEWSRWLRQHFELEDLIAPWVVSGDFGARKPEPAIYRQLIDVVGAEPHRILLVDDRERNLDAAARLGFQVALFGSDESKHRRIENYAALSVLLGL